MHFQAELWADQISSNKIPSASSETFLANTACCEAECWWLSHTSHNYAVSRLESPSLFCWKIRHTYLYNIWKIMKAPTSFWLQSSPETCLSKQLPLLPLSALPSFLWWFHPRSVCKIQDVAWLSNHSHVTFIFWRFRSEILLVNPVNHEFVWQLWVISLHSILHQLFWHSLPNKKSSLLSEVRKTRLFLSTMSRTTGLTISLAMPTMWPSPVISWITNATVTIVISTINHSYWIYLHQLSYRTGASLIVAMIPWGLNQTSPEESDAMCWWSARVCSAPP